MNSYSEEITIERPVQEVVDLFAAIEHYPDWQPDLQDYVTFSGKPLQEGAKSRMVFRENSHDNVKMVEEILENRLPGMLRVKYATDGIISYQTHIFRPANEGATLYRIETENDLEGLMKVMGVLNPSHFKKQTLKFMESFKEFVESRHD